MPVRQHVTLSIAELEKECCFMCRETAAMRDMVFDFDLTEP